MTPPVIGAALMVKDLPSYRDWLFEKDRDLEIQDFFRPDLMASGDVAPVAEEARKMLDGFAGRIGIHGPFWGLPLNAADPEVRGIVSKRLLKGLDACMAVGGDLMVMHSPYSTWDDNNLDMAGSEARDWMLELVAETLAEPVVRARDMGVTLVLENIEDKTPGDRKRLAAHLGADVVRLSVDTGHAHYAHGSTGAPPVDYFIRSAGNELAHVHLQDADGFADRHWAIGEGTILWPSVFRALGELESNPRLVLELRDCAGIPASMAFLAARGLGQ